MRRFGQWLVNNADGMLALTITITIGVLGSSMFSAARR
jgi:hypothetical protein